MDAPDDDIAFLATSPNRVGVLEALADGSLDRHELQAALDISQPTASRILRDLRDRGWIVRHGHEYKLTRIGDLTVGAFNDFHEELDAVHHLSDVADMLPVEGFDFDLSRLRTADVVRVAEGESGMARTHENAQLAAADHVRILTGFAPPQGVETSWRAVTTGSQRFELVIEGGTVAAIRADSDLTRWMRDVVVSARAEIYRFDGDIPYPILITDDTVHLALPKDEDTGGAWISTEDEVVFDWAQATFEDHRNQAERLTEDEFPDGDTVNLR